MHTSRARGARDAKKKKKMQSLRYRLIDLEAGLLACRDDFEDLDERYCSSHSSGDEDDAFDGAVAYREQHDDRPCMQALIFFTVITCLTIVLAVVFVDAADVTKPPLNTSHNRGGSVSAGHWRQQTYEPGSSPERYLVCTIGGNESPEFRAYPPDGVCNWIIYTHVGYEENSPNGTRLAPRDPGSWASWEHFLRLRAQYTATRLLPSHAWRDDLALMTRQARSLNRTLRSLSMAGLAFLNVRISVDRVPALAEALETLAWANPGMFLALGASFEQLADATASRLVPAWLLDKLVTPLSLFVLETHLPAPGGVCTAGFSTARQPSYYTRGGGPYPVGRLTFLGARAFLEQPAFRYADPKDLARCVSVLAGAIVFHVLANERPVPGAPCSHWSLAKVASVCRMPSVRDDVEAVAMYGSKGDGAFFSYESAVHMWAKVFTMLQSMLFSGMPTCLAVYALDLDASPGLCDMHQERPTRLIYRAYEVLKALKTDSSDNSTDDSFE